MHKRMVALLICLAMVLPITVSALDVDTYVSEISIYKDYVFYGAKSGNVMQLDTSNKSGDYVIQESVNGHTVSKIEDGLLYGMNDDIFLQIPETVTTIDNLWATDLSKVTFICEDDSYAGQYAQTNGIKTMTVAENQLRIDSQKFNNKTITVLYNKLPLNQAVEDNVKSNDYRTGDDKVVLTVTEPSTNVTRNEKLDDSGSVAITASDAATLSIGRTGGLTEGHQKYLTQNYNFKDLGNETTVYLEPDTGAAYIKNVFVKYPDENGNIETYDAYHEDCYIDRVSDTQVTIVAEVDWNSHPEGQILLSQTGSEAYFSGNELTCLLKEKFDTAEDLSIIARSTDGTEVEKKLKIASYDTDWNDLSFDFGTLKVPIPDKIPMLGGTTLDIELCEFPLNIAIEDGKVYAVLGLNKLSSEVSYKNHGNGKTTTSSETESTTATERIKGIFEDVKDGVSDAKDSVKKAKTLLNSFKNKRFKPVQSSKTSIAGEVEVLGYLEGSLTPKGLKWTGGGIIIQAEASVGFNGQYSLGPVPMYWTVEFSVSTEGKLDILNIVCSIADIEAQPFQPLGTISLGGEVGGDTGPGVSNILGAGIGIKGNIDLDVMAKQDVWNYELGGGLSVYARAFFALWSWEKSWKVIQGTWAEGNFGRSQEKQSSNFMEIYADSAYNSSSATQAIMEEMYDISSYDVQDQSYFDGTKMFFDNGFNVYSASSDLTPMESNVYKMPQAQLVRLENGTQIMVWIGGVANRPEPNKTAIYYSYMPDNGNWSTPQVISDDGTADFQPVLVSSGNTAWVAWQNLNRTFTTEEAAADTAMETIASSLEICAAQFNGNGFSAAKKVTDNSVYDHSPAIALNKDEGAIYWLQSASNQLFGDDCMTKIMKADLSNGTVATGTAVCEPQHPIKGLAAGATETSTRWAATVDMDDNLLTTEDTELFVDGSRFTNNDVIDSGPVFCDGVLYWYQDGVIYDENYHSMLPQDMQIGTDNFHIYKDENGRTALIYFFSEGAQSEVYGIFADPQKQTVSQPEALTSMKNHTEPGVGYYSEDSGLVIPCEETEVTAGGIQGSEDGSEEYSLPFGQTDLHILTYVEKSQLSIEDVYYDSSRLVAGNSFTVYVLVKNTGVLPAEKYDVVLWDDLGKMPVDPGTSSRNLKVADFRATTALAGGDTAEVALTFKLPEDFDGTYTLTLTPSDGSDGSDEYDENAIKTGAVASESVTLSSQDLMMSTEAYWNGEGKAVVKGTIANAGTKTYSNIPVKLYAVDTDSNEETLITTQNVSLGELEQTVVSVTLDTVDVDMYRMEVSEQEGEINTTNNSDFCVFQESSLVPLSITKLETEGGKIIATVSVSLDDIEADSVGLVAATYRSDGAMIDYTEQSVSEISTYTVEMKSKEAAKVKCFLLDNSTQKPLCEAVEMSVSNDS